MVLIRQNIRRVEQPLKKLTAGWPRDAREVAIDMVHKYGQPHEASQWRLVWHYNSPWQWTCVWRDGTHHNFPKPHLDILEQAISLAVPLEKVSELVSFHGGLCVYRTKGELSVCCHNEAMNILTLNLAQEIAANSLGIPQARKKLAHGWKAYKWHWPEDAYRHLQVTVGDVAVASEGGMADPDKPTRAII